ncbi:MAG: PKD domain-containing protein [Chitinophagales bacterium]|nr:PKD domain-containing protein [Bacteroidota bacterium]
MRKKYFYALWLCCLCFTELWSHNAASGKYFVANKGQFPAQVNYFLQGSDYQIFFENNTWTHVLYGFPESQTAAHDYFIVPLKAHAYKINFLNANKQTRIIPSEKNDYYQNYYIGNNAQNWASKVPTFQKITYQNVYPAIDAEVLLDENGIKYNWIVQPQGKVQNILAQYEGIDQMCIDNGVLILETAVGKVQEMLPLAYQDIRGKRKKVDCFFSLYGNVLSFEIKGKYNENYPLVIDPQVVFSTFTGSNSDNWGFTATYDLQNNLYAGGICFGANYPTTTGAFDVTYNSGNSNSFDISISKFNPTGTALLYSTFLGGSSGETPQSLVVNSQNQLIVFGSTGSNNFPIVNGFDSSFNSGPSAPLFQDSSGNSNYNYSNGSDIILAVFQEDGSALVGSTYFGGNNNDGLNLSNIANLDYNYGDAFRGEVITDAADNIYIASCTYSANLPTTNGSFQAANGGSQDALVAKFNSNVSNLQWCTYLGGNSYDAAYSLKLNANNEIYVVGGTRSANFPVLNGLHNSYLGGQADGFIVHISANGQNLLSGSFLGTNQYDQAYFVEIDEENNIYALGQNLGNYSVSTTYNTLYTNSNAKQFIHKLNAALNTTLFATTIGAPNSDKVNFSPTAFLVDKCGRIYFSGWGGNVNIYHNQNTGFINNMPITSDAFQSSTDGSDMYFLALDKNATDLMYGSYWGGSAGEHVDGGTSRFNKEGTIYQAICAGCGGTSSFPTTPGVWSNTNNSYNCNLGAVKIDFEPNLIFAAAAPSPAPVGCVPFTVNFQNNSNRGETFFWDFGDGATSMEFAPTHIYNQIDTFLVQLIAIDSTACNIADTAYTQVFIPDSSQVVTAGFTYLLPQLCEPYEVDFTNTSVTEEDISNYKITWNFGDGATSTQINPQHTYAEGGNYNVSLHVTTGPPCNNQSTINQQIYITPNPYVSADFNAPIEACSPVETTFEALYPAQQYWWDLGDGNTAQGSVVNHTYAQGGVYSIILTAIDSSTCNIMATQSYDLLVTQTPTANFTLSPDTAYVNQVVTFTNLSEPLAELSFHWDFGDGDTSTVMHPQHQYIQTGYKEVCLRVQKNGSICDDIFCLSVYISNDFAFDVPSAFTPNGDNLNDKLIVQGFGFEYFEFKIFNRWGEKVFETNEFERGWDGTWRNVPQEMDVYTYVFSGVAAGGIAQLKKGNITLIR